MAKMQAITFTYVHDYRGEIKKVDNWAGYAGGNIPAGLIVARLSGLELIDRPTNMWSVFHKSGYVVNFYVALRTRKQAIALAAKMGAIMAGHGLSWDMTKDEILAKVYGGKLFQTIRNEEIPAAIREVIDGR